MKNVVLFGFGKMGSSILKGWMLKSLNFNFFIAFVISLSLSKANPTKNCFSFIEPIDAKISSVFSNTKDSESEFFFILDKDIFFGLKSATAADKIAISTELKCLWTTSYISFVLITGIVLTEL